MALNFEEICRLCLRSNLQTFDIFTCYCAKKKSAYSEMISNCTRLTVNEYDGLPRLICKECVRLLKRTYTFNVQCEESDKILKSYIESKDLLQQQKDANTTVKVEDVYENGIKDEEKNGDVPIQDFITHENGDIKSENLQNISDNSNWDVPDVGATEQGLTDDDIIQKNDSDWDADDDNILLTHLQDQKNEDVKTVVAKVIKKKKRRKELVDCNIETLRPSKLPHQCDICGKFLSTKSNLKAHKICHTENRPYKCDDCDAAFKGYSGLYQHRRKHTGETPYHCEYCSKQFRRRTSFVNHVRIHTGEKSHSCGICFKSFTQSAQLYTHMRRHNGDKPYLCQQCGKGFPIQADLKVHQRVHNGEKPYSCHLCEKTFATSGNLSIHVRIHKQEIRYRCSECQRGFVTCSAYKVHLKRHKGQRDYQCKCGKRFYTSSSLNQHKVVHTGEKRFQCKLCEKKFSQSGHLTRHFKKEHAKVLPTPTLDEYRVVLPPKQNEKGVNFDVFVGDNKEDSR